MEESVDEKLLSAPTAKSESFKKVHIRSSCNYEICCGPFRLEKRNYVAQYAHIYYARLESMRRYLKEAAVKKWGKEVSVKKSLLEASGGERCCIIGTVFKKMELKPTILKEISTNHHLLPQPPRAKFISSSDLLVIEDSTQRMYLCGNIPSQELVTGVIVGLLGKQLKGGSFEVEDYTFAGLADQKQNMEVGDEEEEEDKYVLLVSGLGMGSSWCDQLSLEMLVDYVTGQLGGPSDHKMCSRIVRVIIAGNSITHKPAKTTVTNEKNKFQYKNYSANTIEAVKEMDDFLVQLTSCVPVDLMPGSNDPANHQLPQQPLHPCMFPQSWATGNLKSLTNPYHTVIDRTRFIGCSGQNIDDIYKFSSLTDRLHILENTLHWKHMLPTTPDTLSCYPFTDRDPFILQECPHVYFSGNQPGFQCRKIQGAEGQSVLVVCVPSFDLTHSAVLITLGAGKSEAQEISFATSLSHAPNPHLEEVLAMEREVGEEGKEDERETVGMGEVTLLHLMDDDDDD